MHGHYLGVHPEAKLLAAVQHFGYFKHAVYHEHNNAHSSLKVDFLYLSQL